MFRVEVDFDTDARHKEQIENYFHCATCIEELPQGVAPKDFARLNIGLLPDGRIQVWCVRHNCNVAVISWEGKQIH